MKNKEALKKTAKERIGVLFEQARIRPTYAKRYMQLVKKLQKRYRLRLKPEQNRSICKKCFAFLVPGKTCVLRKRKNHIVVHCMDCNNIMRFGTKVIK